MSKAVTGYVIRNKKNGQFLASGGSRNVKNLAAARFWATEAGAQGWLDANRNAEYPQYMSSDTRIYMRENGNDLEVIPVKLKVEV